MAARGVLPGFGLSLGVASAYFALLVLRPLAGLVARSATVPAAKAVALFTDPRTLSAFRVSLLTSAGAALASVPIGVLLAWVLERYRFAGRLVLDAAIDLPFALPTAVAGIALTTLYVPQGWLGRGFAAVGIEVAYTPLGIGVALLFVGLPFIVRTVQPVLAGLDRSADEAALVLGASPSQIVRRVILPVLMPAIATGAALAFARAVGEFGAVSVVSGRIRGVTNTMPLHTEVLYQEYNLPVAFGVATLLAGAGLLTIGVRATLDWRQARARARGGRARLMAAA